MCLIVTVSIARQRVNFFNSMLCVENIIPIRDNHAASQSGGDVIGACRAKADEVPFAPTKYCITVIPDVYRDAKQQHWIIPSGLRRPVA
jgi:hypothetical protein